MADKGGPGRVTLDEIGVRGYKSIDSGHGLRLRLGRLTVLVGPNGSGKSCLLSFFEMLDAAFGGNLQKFIMKEGADELLHYGARTTQGISATCLFSREGERAEYGFTLAYGKGRLFVDTERAAGGEGGDAPRFCSRAGGAAELSLAPGGGGGQGLPFFRERPPRCRRYSFFNTSDTAKIRIGGYDNDAAGLRPDAGNLAAFLKMLKTAYPRHYGRILFFARIMMPQLRDFVLEPIPSRPGDVRLDWTDDSGSGYRFSPFQLSDGALRFLALAALLLQPPGLMPPLIVLDEPELGLHPAAINALETMLGMASRASQILVATQSTRLLDLFDPRQIRIVERAVDGNGLSYSTCRELDPGRLAAWLERYSLSELWEKNTFGGLPQ